MEGSQAPILGYLPHLLKEIKMETITSTNPYEIAFILTVCEQAQVVDGRYLTDGDYLLTLTVSGHGVEGAQAEWQANTTDRAIFMRKHESMTRMAFKIIGMYKEKERLRNGTDRTRTN
jgi:hypothetical protein